MFKKKLNCQGCTLCCDHVSMEIDTPKSKHDFDDLMWFVMHENVIIFIDHDGSWNIEFKSRCKELTKDGLCKIYSHKPEMCKMYSIEECEKHGRGKVYKRAFKTKEDIVRYVKKYTKIKNFP